MNKQFEQIKLTSNTIIKPFKCKEEDLNGFLFDDAKLFQKELLTVTYLLEDKKTQQTVAYFSLLADKIVFNPNEKGKWNKLNREIPNSKRRKSYPAIKIGRLAVDDKYSGKGIGRFLVDRIKYRFATDRIIGCRFITVDALESAIPFYIKNGFQFLTETDKDEDTRLMFFDLINCPS